MHNSWLVRLISTEQQIACPAKGNDRKTQGLDQSWTFEEAIERSKAMKLKFAPGTKGKAFYSDTNYKLLGRIIETITDKSFNLMIRLIQ
ncbi:MAG: beta-lactamase family protein [Bacteroidetes bacterium]|nr:beta-lactamase family protein [Bacteroidota bacterium]